MKLREKYDNDLVRLKESVRAMGQSVQNALRDAVATLTSHDASSARRVIENDRALDEQERDIEHLCMTLLLRQQPIASDLRKVSSSLKMVTDLERMGDNAADIAEIGLYLPAEAPLPQVLTDMAGQALAMEQAALDAFLKGSLENAKQVIAMDDKQDDLFNTAKKELAQRLAKNPEDADDVLDLLMIAKYLERLSDHSVNVAEWTIFCQTGLYKGQQIV